MSSGRQHQVPQFHLREFRSRPGEGLIFQLELPTGRWRERSIRDCAAKHAYYDSRKDDDIQKLETQAAPVLRRLANCRLPMRLRDGNRELVATYVVNQYLRVEPTRQFLLDAMATTWNKITEDGHATSQETAEPLHIIEEFRAKTEATLPRFQGSDGSTYDPMAGLNAAGLVSEARRSGRWRIAVAPPGNPFVTCDNPVVFYLATAGEGAFTFAGRGGEKALSLWFPLSPDRGLMIGGAPWQSAGRRAKGMTSGVQWQFARLEIRAQELSPEAVVFCNRRTAANAERFLYSARRVPVETLNGLLQKKKADGFMADQP
ncbi:MAG: DUF4238 domain-containing protein [Chloroflexi bacterium]|nr:DUF4238 domain-containing protein [Chloroflexota bacterium]